MVLLIPLLNILDFTSELNEYKKSKCLSNEPVFPAVPQRSSFFNLPWHIKLEVYEKLKGADLINFHLAFPNLTSELAPFYYLKSSFEYEDDDLWPVLSVNTVPKPIEEELIHAAYSLTLSLEVYYLKTFNGISDELQCKVTKFNMKGNLYSGRFAFSA